SDAARFFGQDHLVDTLAERIDAGAAFTAVVGPSGSGKSSAVQAGLIPRLRRDAPHLGIAIMQPGAQPFAELEAALASCAGAGPRPTITQLRSSEAGIRDAALRLLDDRT